MLKVYDRVADSRYNKMIKTVKIVALNTAYLVSILCSIWVKCRSILEEKKQSKQTLYTEKG